MKPDTVIVVEDDTDDARPVAVRVPRPEPRPERMVGAERGAYEDQRRAFVVTVPTWGRKTA